METSINMTELTNNTYSQLNGAALAYIGDAIYEVYIRQYVIKQGKTQPNKLHRAAIQYVEAKGQAKAMKHLLQTDLLNAQEIDVYKRGRNHKANTKAKNASIGDYRQATGFESLLGWLYLTQQVTRLEWVMDQAIMIINTKEGGKNAE